MDMTLGGFLLLLVMASLVEAEWLNDTPPIETEEPVFFPRIWLGVIEAGQHSLEKARNNMTLTKCEKQLGMYADGLTKKISWAITMYDSTGKQGPGLLRGRVTWHGDFYQCINLGHRFPVSNEMLTAHYCSAIFEKPSWLKSVIEKKELPFDVHLPELTVDLCVPSSCNESDLEFITKKYIIKNTNTTHVLKAMHCHRKMNIADDTGALISATILCLILACVVCGSLIDMCLAITTPDVDEQSEMRIGFHKRAASLLSRAGSVLSRRGSSFSLQEGRTKKRGSIFSRRLNVYKTQVSYISTHSKDISIQSDINIPIEEGRPRKRSKDYLSPKGQTHGPTLSPSGSFKNLKEPNLSPTGSFKNLKEPNLSPTGSFKNLKEPNLSPTGSFKNLKEPNLSPTGSFKNLKEQSNSIANSLDSVIKEGSECDPTEKSSPKSRIAEHNGYTRPSVDLSLQDVKAAIPNSSPPLLLRSISLGASPLKARKGKKEKLQGIVELDVKGLSQKQTKVDRLKKDAYGRSTSLESILEDNGVSYDPSTNGEIGTVELPIDVLATTIEEKTVTKKKRSIGQTVVDAFLCFSLQRNLTRILGEGNANYLFCLNGVRVLSITWIVLGNLIKFLYQEPDVVANSVEVPEVAQGFLFQVVINTTFAADTFFILSGTLLAYTWMKQDEKRQLNNPDEKFTLKKLLMFYVHRFVRIAPCFYILIMTFTNLLPYFGQGPRWKYISKTISRCKDHWWANALFISNFYKADEMCMAWTYYLVNDFQFYLISPLILIPLTKCPKLGYLLLVLLVLTQIISTAVLNKNINGNILRMDGGYFENVYAKPYCRVGVFAIGIALGYSLFKAGRRVYFRKMALTIGWCVSLCTISVMVFITYAENRVGGTPWSATETAVYEAISRPAWALGVSWIIFCCCIGQGGFIEKFLSWNFFVPLCRITYGIYLLHPLLIVVIVDTSTSLIYINEAEVLLLFVFVLVCAVASALVLMSCIEGPFIRLESLLFR